MADPRIFRKKPVVIEAMWLEETADPQAIATWCGGRIENNLGHPSGKIAISIPTLEGVMTAQFGDWIIQGIQGEFYPCKSDIFEATYDEVSHG